MRDFPLFERLLREKPHIRLGRNIPLSRHSSFKIGGKADFFLEVGSPEDLSRAVMSARRAHIPYYIVGEGTNILFDDRGYRGLIIRNHACGIREGTDAECLDVDSGAKLSGILQWAVNQELEGLEFLAGIPGTAGGAFYTNAGAFGRCIADVVECGRVLDHRGEEARIPGEAFEFGYRSSVFQRKHDILLGATLRLKKGERKTIRSATKAHVRERQAKHPPWGTACAGSYFKNPLGDDGRRIPAGRLLEEAGARGLRVGDAAVYDKHCNFIVNLGRATSGDVRRLADELKAGVLRTFGILLEEEVFILREDASMS